MPWRGAEYPGEFPTLGYLVADLIESVCVIPDGVDMGKPFVLPEEQLNFLLWHYRVRPDAAGDPHKPSSDFAYRRSQLVRPQKWGKGPFAASMICTEGHPDAPVLFAGWDANGEPVGRPWPTPWVQVTAVSLDQTDNIWRSLKPMIELGPLADLFTDTGETRINLPGGGYIEPVTASGRSRLGQRITFAVQDETHSWLKINGGWTLADNQRRNLGGMGGRSIETTNAWDPAEQSVAQQTNESKATDIYRDYPQPPKGSIRNKRERRKVLQFVYSGAPWVDLDRIDAEIEELLGRDPAQGERFFMNRAIAGESVAFDVEVWAQRTEVRPVADGSLISLGFDGARWKDTTGIVATDIETGHQWPAGIWARPENAPDGWEVDEDEVDQTVAELFDRYQVGRMYADPAYWESAVARWSGRHPKVVFEWWTHRHKAMAYAVRAYKTAMTAGEMSHDGDSVFAEHIANCRKKMLSIRDEDGHQLWLIQKERDESPKKIDLAMAAILSWEARTDAVAAGVKKRGPRRAAGFGGRR